MITLDKLKYYDYFKFVNNAEVLNPKTESNKKKYGISQQFRAVVVLNSECLAHSFDV